MVTPVDIFRRKKCVLYSKAYDYTMALRETFNGGGSESSVMARYKAPYLLALDEYHEVKDTDFTGPALERLIDYRRTLTGAWIETTEWIL